MSIIRIQRALLESNDHPVSIHEHPVSIQWASNEHPMSIQWASNTHQVSIQWASNEHPMIILWASKEHPISILWAQYEHPVRILWASYEHPMIILWVWIKCASNKNLTHIQWASIALMKKEVMTWMNYNFPTFYNPPPFLSGVSGLWFDHLKPEFNHLANI